MPPAMSRSLALHDERGMTLVEVMVAIVILLVGVLGAVNMIDGANATTSKNKSREGANSVGREILEIARSVSYRDLTPDQIVDAVSSRPGLADSKGAAGYSVESRNIHYDVTITSCSMDDPKDGLGTHDDPPTTFCSDSDALTSGNGTDRNADDYKRVAVVLSWTIGQATYTSKQTTFVTNPVGGFGPSIISLVPSGATTVTSGNNVSFTAKSSSSAAEVNWAINGDVQGKASGSGIDWNFNWNLNKTKPDGTAVFPDCTYVVSAQAFDDKGRAGAPKAVTMKLNRNVPLAPRNFEGGRNLNGDRVDLQWLPNDECDLDGYRVYRGTAPDSINTLVCPSSGTDPIKKTECVDETAPGGVTLYYEVVGVDRDSSNVLREGTRSDTVTTVETNNPPTVPASLVACAGGTPGCIDINGDPVSDGATAVTWAPSIDPDGDAIYFYRVYRDGSTYADRYDVLYPVSGKPLTWVDSNASGGPHDYRISAVDSRFGESALSEAVTK